MSYEEIEERPIFIIEFLLDNARHVLVAHRDVEVTEEGAGYGVEYGVSFGE